MNEQQMKQEIERLVVELKARAEKFAANHKSLNSDQRHAWIACKDAVKRAGGYTEDFVLDPGLYSFVLKKIRAVEVETRDI